MYFEILAFWLIILNCVLLLKLSIARLLDQIVIVSLVDVIRKQEIVNKIRKKRN